jgi:hypothetical protein
VHAVLAEHAEAAAAERPARKRGSLLAAVLQKS